MRFIVFSLSILLALFIAEVGICLPGPQIDYQEDWNTSNDLGEWESNTTVTNVIPSDHNGNPGGYLNSSGTAAGSFDIGALTKIQQVTGDFRGSTWSISVDVQFIAGNFDALWIRFRYKDSTENGWVFPLASTFPPGTWKTYFVAFNPDWTDGEARAHGWLTDRDIIPNANPSQPWNITMSRRWR